MDRILAARGVLLDLDGTLVAGETCLPGAAALLARVAGRAAIVSNDAEHTPTQMAARLRRLGLALPRSRILLAGALAIDSLARERPGARVLLLASRALGRYAEQRGLRLVPPLPGAGAAEVVMLGRDRAFSYARLQAAANAVRAGAALLACNPDHTHPGHAGGIVPETGALLAAVLACTGPVPVRVFGKPEPSLFHAGMAALGTTPQETIMLGDNPATDGAGALRLGLGFVPAPIDALCAPGPA